MSAWDFAIGAAATAGFLMMAHEYFKRVINLKEIALLLGSLAGVAWFAARLWGMQ